MMVWGEKDGRRAVRDLHDTFDDATEVVLPHSDIMPGLLDLNGHPENGRPEIRSAQLGLPSTRAWLA